MSDALVNKVASSGLITLKPEEWVSPDRPGIIDLKDFLFRELILREQEFRDRMKTHDWNQYQGKVVCVFCSVDAIIPGWAYMLIASMAAPLAKQVFMGTPDQWISQQLMIHIDQMDITPFLDKRVIIKGCSNEIKIGPEIYVALTSKLVPVVKSLMFGEPCSTVPVFKRPGRD